MTWNTLRSKCRRKSDYIITLFVTNEISLLLTWLLVKTRVTPNQVTIASIVFGLFCAVSYAGGFFITGSIFFFISHVLDCTDGNLARAKETFSKLGQWLDCTGDRVTEVSIFIGVCFFYYNTSASVFWILLPLLDSLLLLLYYYIVDIGLSLEISPTSSKSISFMKFKNVNVKWGLYEPVIYGFILLAPFGLLKLQLIGVLLLIFFGLIHQLYKNFRLLE